MPESWNVPLWPVWVCAMLVVLLVGLVGLSLSWSWARDDASAGLVANRVLGKEPRPERKKAEPLDPSLAPDASWWRSTPGHQFLWALALEKAAAGADPDRAEAVRFYLHAARSSAPAQAAARFALAHPAPNEPKVPELSECLGLTRDVIALAWMGQRLLEVGKTEAALRAFGEALDMACRADLRDLDSPAFLEDAQVHRYALPHEVLIGPIVLALAEKRELAFSEWAPVLPACAVAPLAASRALHELGRTNEAEQALDLVLTGTDEPQLAGASPAVHTAAQAEALALRGRWVEAEALYREAIDDMPNDTFRRSWWMNLADIYLRLNDDARKRSAWEAAKGTDPKEEITRRVIQSQTQAGLGVGSSRKRTPGPASDRSLEPRGDRPEGTTTRPQASKADR
jgi:tetratricopeptide (TPR) repeat protein